MSRVVIKECPDYELSRIKTHLNAGMEFLGGWDKYISPGMTVLLKVNLIGPKGSDSAAVTHAVFVRALTQILKAKKCDVWIGDSSGGAIAGIAPTAKSFTVSGLQEIAESEGAVIKNFDREGVVEVKPTSGYVDKMYLAKPLFDADFVINLPKLKTHSAAMYTGAVKNLFGCIPGLRKAEYHKLAPDPGELGHIVTDIHQATNVGLHIMDGISAMQGEGPTAGEVYAAKKILFSTDPLALDAVGTVMLGMAVEDVPMLVSATSRGLGASTFDAIELVGDHKTPPQLSNFKLPKRYRSSKKRNYKAVIKVIDLLKARPRVNLKRCKQCNMCVESCPVQAINQVTKLIDYTTCIECMCCHELCLHQAVELRRDNFIADTFMRFAGGRYR